MGEAGSVAKKDHRRRTPRARGGADARMAQGLEVRFCRGVIACFEVRDIATSRDERSIVAAIDWEAVVERRMAKMAADGGGVSWRHVMMWWRQMCGGDNVGDG